MRTFFEQTAPFWILTRGIILAVIAIWLCKVDWPLLNIMSIMFLMVCISVAYFFMESALLFHEIKGDKLPFLTRTFAGGLSILIGFSFVLIAFIAGKLYLLIITLWMFVFGLYDILMIGGYRQEE